MSNNFIMTASQNITLLVQKKRFTHLTNINIILTQHYFDNVYYTAQCLTHPSYQTNKIAERKYIYMHVPQSLPFIEHFLKVITFCVSVPVCKGQENLQYIVSMDPRYFIPMTLSFIGLMVHITLISHSLTDYCNPPSLLTQSVTQHTNN